MFHKITFSIVLVTLCATSQSSAEALVGDNYGKTLWSFDANTASKAEIEKCLRVGKVTEGADGSKWVEAFRSYGRKEKDWLSNYGAMIVFNWRGLPKAMSGRRNTFIEIEVYFEAPNFDPGMVIRTYNFERRYRTYAATVCHVPIGRERSWERRTVGMEVNAETGVFQKMARINSGYVGNLRTRGEGADRTFSELRFVADLNRNFGVETLRVRRVRVYEAKAVRPDPRAMPKGGYRIDNDKMVAKYSKAIERDPTNDRNYMMRAYAYESKRQYHAALQDYRAAMLHGENVSMIQAAGRAALACGYRDEAEQLFQQYLDALDKAVRTSKRTQRRERFGRILALYGLGKFDAGDKVYAEMKLDPINKYEVKECGKEMGKVKKWRKALPPGSKFSPEVISDDVF